MDHGASGNYPPSRSYQMQLPDRTGFQNRSSARQCLPVPAHLTESGLLVQWTLATSPYPTLPVPNRYRYHQLTGREGQVFLLASSMSQNIRWHQTNRRSTTSTEAMAQIRASKVHRGATYWPCNRASLVTATARLPARPLRRLSIGVTG